MAFLRAARVAYIHPRDETALDEQVLVQNGRTGRIVPRNIATVAAFVNWLKEPAVDAVLVPGEGWLCIGDLADSTLPASFSLHVREISPDGVLNPVNAAVDEVAAIAENVQAFTSAGTDPATQELRDYLEDFTPLQGLIPISCPPEVADATSRAAFFTSSSILGSIVSQIIYMQPQKGSGKPIANSRALEYSKILTFLRDNLKRQSQVAFTVAMHNAESSSAAGSSQTPRFGKRKRPDFLYEFHHLTLLYAEGKEHEKIAFREIASKLRSLPPFVYGEVRFMLAFAIAERSMQLFVKRPNDQDPELLSKQFDLNQFGDRATLCLTFFKLYFLMLGMAQRVTKTTGMLPLFKQHRREYSTVQLDALGCWKTIKKFRNYRREFGIDTEDVLKAYNLPRTDQLAYAIVSPVVVTQKREEVYTVRFGPLGLPAEERVSSEDDCRKLARDVLTALSVLHNHGLVHRDVRLDNIIYCPPKDCFVLIDLETVGKSKRTVIKPLRDYELHTLVKGKYTTTSDLYQLGVLLRNITMGSKSPGFVAFIQKLQSHKEERSHGYGRASVVRQERITAEEMLQDSWLLGAASSKD